jgi:hypothetical protein
VILSDGDVVFQPRKVQRSGLWHVVEGRVLIYIHKELMLDDLQRCHPAQHYVMVDDKLRILTAMKAQMRTRLTTVFVRQGHYAHDPDIANSYPPADVTIDAIAGLPEQIRGYGHVKERNLAAARTRWAALLAEWRHPEAPRAAA